MIPNTFTVAQLIEKLKDMPQDALVLCAGVPDGYRAVDFVERFDSKDLLTSLLKDCRNVDPDIKSFEGDFIYIDCISNLI